MDLHYWEKQLILYTKNHYKRMDYEKDLPKFASALYGLSLEHTDPYNVLHMVTDLYEKLVDNGLIRFSLPTFIQEVFRRSTLVKGQSMVSHDDVIRQLLVEIQNLKVHQTGFDLGMVNEELFQLIQEDKQPV